MTDEYPVTGTLNGATGSLMRHRFAKPPLAGKPRGPKSEASKLPFFDLCFLYEAILGPLKAGFDDQLDR